jgi:magnesium-transporting ATPase (P-type)
MTHVAYMDGWMYVYYSDKMSVQLRVGDIIEEYKLLHVFEFNSNRKRMSAIFQTSEGRQHATQGNANILLILVLSHMQIDAKYIVII